MLEVDRNVHTLLDFHFHPRAKATNGTQGRVATVKVPTART